MPVSRLKGSLCAGATWLLCVVMVGACGGSGEGTKDGPTAAPDLMSVGGFKPGPPNDDGSPQTIVTFGFDSPVYLAGGDRSNFHLVPLDGGDAVDARSAAAPDDSDGDADVRVLFSGKLSKDEFARGYVDSKVVTSREAGATKKAPAGVNQAVPVSHRGRTENPDLVKVKRDGDQVLFSFDEPLTQDDVIQSTSGLRVYFAKAEQSSRIPAAGALAVKRRTKKTLRAYYGNDLPGGRSLTDAVGAFAVQGTVQAAEGSRGGNDGKNAFDEHRPLGNTGAKVCPAAHTPNSAAKNSGPTTAPDLLSVGSFRRGPFTSQFTPTTCVDFTFDQSAYIKNGTRSNFRLVPEDGGDAMPGSTNVMPPHDHAGDRVVTVVFPGRLHPSDFPRGAVDTGVVTSRKAGPTPKAPLNVNQAAAVSHHGRTENPDLVQAERVGDQVQFRFDEPLTSDDVVQSTSGLRVYFAETEQANRIREAGALKVERHGDQTLRASFGQDLPEGMALADAVGAFVVQGTVQAAKGSRAGNDGKSAFDERAPLDGHGG